VFVSSCLLGIGCTWVAWRKNSKGFLNKIVRAARRGREGGRGGQGLPVKMVRSTLPSSIPYMGTMERWEDVLLYESCMFVNQE
jgi:hypothetical protein